MKEPAEDINWALIAKHLGKELDDKEKDEFAKWMKESGANGRELENAEKVWQISSMKETQLFDTENGWSKMKNRIHPVKDFRHSINRHIIITSLKVAASLLILISLTFTAYWIIGKTGHIQVTAENEKLLEPVVLPDGSQVYLNAGTTIRYPKTFSGDTRKVELVGEAFFKVTRNPNQPFIIQTPQAQVKVLGTSFDVKACKKSDRVSVVVETGTVELSSRDGSEIIQLTRGNTGVYYLNSKKLEMAKTSDVNAFAWKTNEIVFKNSSLEYVSKTLENVFSKTIILNNTKLKSCPLNANFKNRDLESILEVIKGTYYNLNIKKTDRGYIISGPGC
jgi:ferric-dicitrate binding protein FerR (iron transport regulator)